MPRPRHTKLSVLAGIVLAISLGLYVASLFMHVTEVKQTFLGVPKVDSYRLLNTIHELYDDGELGLAIIITAFTIVFPVSKYVALAFVLFGRSSRARNRVLLWVKNLGQWSMGDVFVVAMMVVIVRVNNGVAQVAVKSLPGLWVFAASVLLSMIASAMLGFWMAREENPTERDAAS